MDSPQAPGVWSRDRVPTRDLGAETISERCPLRATIRVRARNDNMTRRSQGTVQRLRQVEVVMGSARTT